MSGVSDILGNAVDHQAVGATLVQERNRTREFLTSAIA